MLDAPSFFLRVLEPIVGPIAATAGQILAVWPGHPSHTLTVLDPTGARIVRHRQMDDGALYGPLLILDADGAIRCLTPDDQAALFRAAAG